MSDGQITHLTPEFKSYVQERPCGVVIEYYSGDINETEYTITAPNGEIDEHLDQFCHNHIEEDIRVAVEIQEYKQGMAP